MSAQAADTTVVLLDDYRPAEWAGRDPLDLVAEVLPEWTVAFTRLDGVMGFCEPEHRRIWIDLQLSGAEQRCTIVHELLHAMRGDATDDPEAEQIVQIETARRLVPLRALRDLLASPETLAEIAAALNVDEDVLQTRLLDLRPDPEPRPVENIPSRSTQRRAARATIEGDTRMTTTSNKTKLTALPPRPSWAKARPAISGPDAYWWSPTIRVSGHQLRLGSSYTRRDDGWHSDGPATVWLEDVSGTEMSRAAARKLRDALSALIDQAGAGGSSPS